MNLHEYQAKEILKSFGVPVPMDYLAKTVDEAVEAAQRLVTETGSKICVIKAQIHAGGRGKGGGVKVAKNIEEVRLHAGNILGMQLVTPQTGVEGKKVHKILVAQNVYFANNDGVVDVKEYYMSILMNRATSRNIIMYSPQGGMDIETVAKETPELIFKEEIDPMTGVLGFQARKIAFNLGLSGNAFKEMVKFVPSLYNAFVKSDASLLEINPVTKTSDDKILAVDAKMKLDDDALYRHQQYKDYRDLDEEDPTEVEASKFDLNFVKLDGNVGCMVNGAGLAMATMDIIKLSGGNPANFLDVGGKANAETVEAGFRIILKDPSVKAILINIFGGIVRCDRIAQGIVQAYKKIGNIQVPVIVRLQGTNSEEGKEIIEKSGLKVKAAVTLKDAADLVKEVVK